MTPPATFRRLTPVHTLVLLALVLLATARSAVGTRLDSLTVDEPWHIVAGVEYLRTNDFRLNPEHPPLVKLVAAANMPATFTLRPKSALSDKGAERDFVEETFFFDNDFRLAQDRARIAVWTLNGAMLLILGALVASAFGMPWAIGTLLFIGLEPTVGAHGPVVMTDLPVALALAIAALTAARLIMTWRWRWALALGVAMGLALAAKHSALPGLAGIGAFTAFAAVWQWHRQRRYLNTLALHAGQLAFVVLVAIGTLWAFYGFHFHAGPNGADDFNRTMVAKLGDLRVVRWRDLLTALDRWHILPRSYIWGLADTVRAGVEGRGDNQHLLWGTMVYGAPPWYTWPSFILSKVPLALLGLAVVGVGALRRTIPTPLQRWSTAVVLALAATHLFALSGSLGTYAGVRHALPVIVALGILAGAGAQFAWQQRTRMSVLGVAGLYAATIVMTARIPRLWEYHNELAGGTLNAALAFGNEGLDLGQRAYEIKHFSDSAIVPTGRPTYSSYWFGEEQAKALKLTTARKVESLADTNRAGIYTGFFIYTASDRRPDPSSDWDPAKVFAGLTMVKRLGIVEVWEGTQTLPMTRASNLFRRLLEYVYDEKGSDYALIAAKATEILDVMPWHLPAAIELGNAYLRMGDRAAAIAAYQRPFAHEKRGLLGALVKQELESHIKRLESGEAMTAIPSIRSPQLE
ncbi:MAG: phospholipid carrier-dependent glycosyltransferase [Gemmatimonadales bacterium]|nr:phospholipid carrier-dependent glycosyltransferase [Gemmatimonadales bacterium]